MKRLKILVLALVILLGYNSPKADCDGSHPCAEWMAQQQIIINDACRCGVAWSECTCTEAGSTGIIVSAGCSFQCSPCAS